MSFLQPFLLFALPLVGLPILIHLINQHRYQTIRWGAMMFLLAANRMSRGYARLRQWLILLFRMLAIAGLVFAVSRPLASGWLGLTAGGRADTTIILLDRSPTMQQRDSAASISKLETGRGQLAQALNMLGSSRWVLIDSATNKARELDTPEALTNATSTEPVSSSADLPSMLQTAHDYIRANRSGRSEIWICSDLRENDWNHQSGRWQTLRDAFLEFTQGVRFHLLAYPRTADDNASIRVTDVRWQESAEGAELLVSLRIRRDGRAENKITLPVEFEIEGARSVLPIEMDGPRYELKDHRIGLERSHKRGWGRVSLPADSNPADNEFFFVFDQPLPRHTVIVTDDANPKPVEALQLAATISPDPAIHCAAEVVNTDQLSIMEWEKVALVLWQVPLPQGDTAQLIQSFVDRGGQVIFLPPETPGSEELYGVKWQSWVESPEPLSVETWRGDQDLLANTQSGASLPVGEIQIRRYCSLAGDSIPLATLRGAAPLLSRVATDRGGVYFCSTNAATSHSTLASNGVVLYVMLQRALGVGAAALGNTRHLIAGDQSLGESVSWKRLAGDEVVLSTDYPFHRGVYTAGEKLLAVNRSDPEDQSPVLSEQRVNQLFRGLDFSRVDDQAGNLRSLVQEIWRLFLASMMVAMVVEAGLCLPKIRRRQAGAGT
jgi:hypothetical protein